MEFVRTDLTRERLFEVLDYSPETGDFRWKKRPLELGRERELKSWNTRFAGKRAGTASNGYLIITIDHKRFSAHRLAWLYCYGEWPSDEIDHIDRNRSNNVISNLRVATRIDQCANTARRKDNTSGFRGVTYFPSRRCYRARINRDGKGVFLGYFPTAEDANQAYVAAAQELYGEFLCVDAA